ncbi:NAD(P)/FAD-dependent oxidoreductase [Microbacterium horticulturae]|uniref:NAD(P)/FAD-dependent oxidoreductase n=1 Tax=Microbacterium horticulturae TaxID=3028316 RepID=A0ABY8C5J0_9MICO|nr:NAD(P)/FAD-dependent oxidoreductase [Microbacterium sp. KACC 23027]WEG09888.1 NAD(P)/FAD-dependent oxidoreductase [Microbacterium sp. KACC 23027]
MRPEVTTASDTVERHVRVLIVGAGFSGIGLAYKLKRAGVLDVAILERAQDVGGVWNSNTYPGCQCDVPSHLYSFSFAPNPDWTSTYSPQPEIRQYLEDCLDRFGVRRNLHTGIEVTQAQWDDAAAQWHVETSEGPWIAQILISAVGPLTEPKLPDVPGIDVFQGKIMHSARWDRDYDLTGRRVASIGTGASAIQYVPKIADQVGELFVFQRSAPWIMPHDKRPITDEERVRFRAKPAVQRRERTKVYVSKEALILGFAKFPKLMHQVEKLSRRHMESQVPDPALRPLLTPDFTLGCKRIVPSNEWYPALQKPNVTLVPHALAEIREHSVVGSDGVERDVDAIIFGTGFHVTDIPFADKVRGRDGELLGDRWKGSPRAYLGTSVPGFPNFFLFLGPNTGLGHSSMIYMIEAQIEHVKKAIEAMDAASATVVEVTRHAHDRFNREVDKKLAKTVWETGGCVTFYQDASGRNATIWPDWTFRYRRLAAKWRPGAYTLSGVARAADSSASSSPTPIAQATR